MEVRIVTLSEIKVARIEHRGAPAQENETARKLVAWRRAHGLLDRERHRSYGLHHTDPRTTPPEAHRVDFCLSIVDDVAPNPYGIKTASLPGGRFAVARDVGSRMNNPVPAFLIGQWLPRSGHVAGEGPLRFHYVNVGPDVRPEEMITDVYLPLL